MFDMSPAVLFSGLLIGLIGMAAFIYGKKSEDPLALFGGIALSIIPFFAHSVLVLWLLCGAVCGGFVVIRRALG
ncbi:MAG: hypothetical protein DHS20C14_22840 [Phycisphaeraceae bacterium]|nr:MAG: hypothetical protein DHS20C14_22840 [Phycisphaeraceae bacterium]